MSSFTDSRDFSRLLTHGRSYFISRSTGMPRNLINDRSFISLQPFHIAASSANVTVLALISYVTPF
jgi:hypothetical protein